MNETLSWSYEWNLIVRTNWIIFHDTHFACWNISTLFFRHKNFKIVKEISSNKPAFSKFGNSRSSRPEVFCKKGKYRKTHRKTPVSESLFWLKTLLRDFIKKETLVQVCSCEISKSGLKRWIFFLFRKKSVEIFQEAKFVAWNIIQFVHTIKFHSYDHDNVSFIERINNFHFSCHRYYSFKSCLKILKKRSQLCCWRLGEKPKLKHSSSSQLLFKDFAKPFTECLSEIEGIPT